MAKLLFLILMSSFYSPGASKLRVEIKNVDVGKGSVVLAIYNNDDDFIKKPVVTRTITASKATLSFDFDLPDGEYAVATYQDLNSNKEMDKTWIGIPTEPYGFSNNFIPKLSAPTFNDCKFRVNKTSAITILLKK